MKFTSVRLVGAAETLDLKVSGASMSDRYILKSIDGLGPVERDVFLSPNADGGDAYEGRRANGREVVILMKLNPNYGAGETVQSLRRNLNMMFSRTFIAIELVDGETTVGSLTGILKKLEIAPFTKEPQAQLTFACEDPYILGQPVFPNPGSWTPKSNWSVPYNGDAPAPFAARIKVLAPVLSVTLTGPWSSKKIYLYGPNFQTNDVVHISTTPGYRDASIFRTSVGQWISLLNGIVLDPPEDRNWPMLLPAWDNKFSITSSEGPDAVEWNALSYSERFEGI